MTFRREGLWHHLAQCARETLTSHLPLKVIPHPGDLLSVLLQRQRSRPSLGVRHTEEASPWGWPGSSLRCSLPQQVLLTLPLYARTLHPSALVHLLMSVPTVASPLASCFLPLPLCNPFFPLQPQPAFQSKTQITLPPCVNPSGGFLSSKE